MTAEIAILNKSAVALATDSALTISVGSNAQKVFDTADKLFELCNAQPIGIMIYNVMQFAGIPLQEIVKEFRAKNTEFGSVGDAGTAFLEFLLEVGREAQNSQKHGVLFNIVDPLLEEIKNKISGTLFSRLFDQANSDSPKDAEQLSGEIAAETIDNLRTKIAMFGAGEFFGLATGSTASLDVDEVAFINELILAKFQNLDSGTIEDLNRLAIDLVYSGLISPSRTGVVISGFGSSERFPSLVSFEIEGVVAGGLKLRRSPDCKIDSDGTRAFIQPFAQKEMVERFLYGLDVRIQEEIIRFCESAVGGISNKILETLQFADAVDLESLKSLTRDAEKAFIENLRERAFHVIEDESRREIESMVEFMPKPELAKMAEALVELTSIKRKVSAGFETVGGPVDVAVISKSDGFVWVKRKHYFPPELNMRYFERLKMAWDYKGESKNAK